MVLKKLFKKVNLSEDIFVFLSFIPFSALIKVFISLQTLPSIGIAIPFNFKMLGIYLNFSIEKLHENIKNISSFEEYFFNKSKNFLPREMVVVTINISLFLKNLFFICPITHLLQLKQLEENCLAGQFFDFKQ